MIGVLNHMQICRFLSVFNWKMEKECSTSLEVLHFIIVD